MVTDTTALRDQGYLLVRDLFAEDQACNVLRAILKRARMRLSDFQAIVDGTMESFHRHGAVADTPDLWPLLIHEDLVYEVSLAVGAPPTCLAGIDTIGVHYSETVPHRDV